VRTRRAVKKAPVGDNPRGSFETTAGKISPTLSGSARSLQFLDFVTKDRFRVGIAPRASRTIGELEWFPAQTQAIEIDPVESPRTIWHAGHINALLSNNAVIVAGAQTGGVWLINPVPIPSYRDGDQAICLSDDWDNPDINCLAYGPDSATQVFVGGNATSLLILLELIEVTGAMVPGQTTAIPLPVSCNINAIVVQKDQRRIVLATDSGVWWSPLPPTLNNTAAYSWQQAQGLPFGSFSGVAVGPEGSIIVAAWGQGPSSGPNIMFRGVWQSGQLACAGSTVNGSPAEKMFRTSVASCADNPSYLYAVAANGNSNPGIMAVIASSDGGSTWQTVTTPSDGLQGDYNNCIAVSPYRPNVVAVGWRTGCPNISTDSGVTWSQPVNEITNKHIHADLHALFFARNPAAEDHLYIGSDGGIVVTRDLCQTFDSRFSRPLGNLQFYGAGADQGTTVGALTASSRFPGLLIGGTQDNGNVFLAPNQEAGSGWQWLDGGDGGLNRFVDDLGALLHFNNDDPTLRLVFWNATKGAFENDTAIRVIRHSKVKRPAPPVTFQSVEVFPAPIWKRDNQLLYAGAGRGPHLYGFFSNPDGTDASLSWIAHVEDTISTTGSVDGTAILVGTLTGRIFLVDTAKGIATEQDLPAGAGANPVIRIEHMLTGTALSVITGQYFPVFALVGKQLLRFDGRTWTLLPKNDCTAFAVDSDSGRIFASSYRDVWVSDDYGDTWIDESKGLPANPHCTDLRIASDGVGARTLYLGTYGRSVWRAAIAYAQRTVDLSKLGRLVAEIVLGVIQDGGGLIRIGGRIIKLPPNPPVQDLLSVLLIDRLAGLMSDEDSRAIRQTAREWIELILKKERHALRGRGRRSKKKG